MSREDPTDQDEDTSTGREIPDENIIGKGSEKPTLPDLARPDMMSDTAEPDGDSGS